MLGYDSAGVDFENNLNIKMIEDNDDVIIPDDVRQFIQQQRQAEQQMQMRAELQQNNTTPTVQSNGSNSIDDWVQQTNSVHHNNGAYAENSP